MRINVPRALSVCRTYSSVPVWSGSFIDPPPTITYVQGVYGQGYSVPWKDNSYIWNTHHRPMNDCVHTQLVNEEDLDVYPHIKVGNNTGFYTKDVYTSRNGYAYAGDLYPPDNGHIRRISNGYIRNDEQVSIACDIALQAYKSGRERSQVTMYFYYCTPDRVPGKLTVPYLTIRFDYYIDWTSEVWYQSPSGTWYAAHGIWRQVYWSIISGGRSGFFDDYPILTLARSVGFLLSGMTTLFYGSSRYYQLPGDEDIYHQILQLCRDYLLQIPAGERRRKWNGWSYQAYNPIDVTIPELLPPSDRFLFHEDDRIQQGIDQILLDNTGLQVYWWNVLVQKAYLDTLDSVPTLNDNSISNIIEIAGFIKSLVIDHKIDLPKSLGDVWLSYRYQYSTSKLDAEEAISFMHRHRELGTLDQWIHCFGVSSINFDNGKYKTCVTCRCGLELRPSDVALLGKIWRALYTYGLQPNFYVVWDMIPYSFIIDWLIPIGNLMHAVDANRMYNGTYYEIKDIVFSISYDIHDEYANRYHQYTRWVQNDIPQLNGFYFFEEDPATTKVKGMRILDTLSLFIGRRK